MGTFLDMSILDEYISGWAHFWMGKFLDGHISGWAQFWMGTFLDGLISGLVAIPDGYISGRAQL